MSGTAPDGGLFVPVSLPSYSPDQFATDLPIHELASLYLKPFFAESELKAELGDICAEAFNFPAPLRRLQDESEAVSVLELFHGPTAAFKDFGARFLAACMTRIVARRNSDEPVTIVVATSGDTGGAVAAAFHRKPGIRVVVLFPEGRVSPRQQHQLTCWGDNIISLAVKGEFDDCQRIAKEMFADAEASRTFALCSANSINVGRLLPQSVYYAHSSLAHYGVARQSSDYIVPTGNLGNGFACAWAKQIGMPVGDMLFATNANRTIPDYLDSGEWMPRASVPTLASAMDVGNPSNMERLQNLWGEAAALNQRVRAIAVSDAEISAQIVSEFKSHGEMCCPHTATAFKVYRDLSDAQRKDRHWVLVATAHAAKFDTIVEPLLGVSIPVPADLERLLGWPSKFDTIEADMQEVISRL